MQINIKGLDDYRFHRPLQLIANLFFEETEIVMNENDLWDIKIQFDLETTEFVKVRAVLSDRKGNEHSASFERSLSENLTEKDRFKQIKNAVSHVYLTVLQEKTGITQKWGILTGVRPTKLLHRKIQEGVPKDIAHQQLKEDYLISDEKFP